MEGGQHRPGPVVTATATPTPTVHLRRGGRGPTLLGAAAFSLGGAGTYLAVLPALLQANLVAGILFAAAGIAQLGLGVGLVTRPTRRRLAAAAAVSLAVAAAWLLTRTVGLPGPNPWLPLDTAVGFTDVLCGVLETLAASLLGVVAARWPRSRRARHPALVVLASTPIVLLAAILALGGVTFATDGFTAVTLAGGSLPARFPGGTMTTVTYCTQHGTRLAMDVYQPTGTARPAPVALYVHGGGMVFGNRKLDGLGARLANHAGALVPRLIASLNRRGMVVASIDYRLPPLTRWPAQIEDAKCAVRFLRAHADVLGIDPGRVGAWGSSAGGLLASLLGVVGPDAGFDHGEYADQSSAVQAVVDMFGAADLTDLGDSEPFMRTAVQVALGSSARVRRSASPISYLAPGADADAGAMGRRPPPFLILHGDEDRTIRPRHSQAFARRLHAAGVAAELVMVHGAAHALDNPSQQPTPDQLTKMVADFFAHSLAGG